MPVLTKNLDGTWDYQAPFAGKPRKVFGTVWQDRVRSTDQKSPCVDSYYVDRAEDEYGLGQIRKRTLVVYRSAWVSGKSV